MNTLPSRPRTIVRALGAVVLGVKGHVVTVEADSRSGRRCFDVVGLPGRMVREAVDRVQAILAWLTGYQHSITKCPVAWRMQKQRKVRTNPMDPGLWNGAASMWYADCISIRSNQWTH
ncbi:hypothetical protein IIA16_00310 [bacterium]|nr:hypothetical protein [bacterium]